MEGLPAIELESWLTYLLIWARLMGIFFLFPFFSYRGIPFMLRLWLTLVVAFLIFLSMESRPVFDFRGPLEMVLILGKEVLTGLALGYLILLMFSVFINAGQMVDLKSGLMMSGVFEPQFGSQVTFMGQFYYLLALVFFMTLNGHHFFLKAIADSFVIIPIEGPFMARETTEGVIRIFAEIFALAFQMVAPIIVVLMVTDIALGLIAKTVPQIHVFVEGLPLKIALSLLLAAILMPMIGIIWEGLLDRFAGIYNQFLFGW